MQKTTDNVFILIAIATVGIMLMVVSFIFIYFKHQNRLAKESEKLRIKEIAHQKELLHAVIESQEEERKRIGRDLHDEVGAAISNLRLVIEMFTPFQEDDNYHQFISSSKNIIDTMMVEVRNISHNLSPVTLSYYGLSTAIGELTTNINQSGKLAVLVENEAPSKLESLALPKATAIYRVIEELLTNTIKHARASGAVIKFTFKDDTMSVDYKDNGIGMEPEVLRKGMGLYNIESRLSTIGATFIIGTAPLQGFSIQIILKA